MLASKRWLAFDLPEMIVDDQQFIRISAWTLRIKLMQIKKLFSIKYNWYATSFDAFLTTCIFVPVLLLKLNIRNCSNYFPGSSFSGNEKHDLRMSSFFYYLASTIYFRTEFRETNLWIQYDYIVFINNFL